MVAVDSMKWSIFKSLRKEPRLHRIIQPQLAPALVAEATEGFDVALEDVGGVVRGPTAEGDGRPAGFTAAPEKISVMSDADKPREGLGLHAASLLADYGASLFMVIAPRISPRR